VAATVEARRLTEAHRLAQARLGVATARQILTVWPLLNVDDLDRTFDRWLLVAMRLVQAQRRASASLAAGYLTAFRTLELGVTEPTTPTLADTIDEKRLTASLLSAGPAVVKLSIARGLTPAKASEAGRVASARSALRHTLNGGRETIVATVESDRSALGWARATSGAACAFCLMLASRGPVYKGAKTAEFHAHDSCSCTVEPVYRRDADWPPGAREARQVWNEVQREAREHGDLKRGTENDALNAFRRALAARR